MIVKVAGDVVGGLRTSPALLFILVLNTIGIVAALYFLLRLGEANSARMEMILKACLPQQGG
jgi:hypothetical protein